MKLDLGKLDGPTFATVAVVDEGILSLTRFKSPDPLKQLFTKRALGVETYETIGWTTAGAARRASTRTGGDAAGKLGRVQPVKPVALWSGVVPVPADGKLRLTSTCRPTAARCASWRSPPAASAWATPTRRCWCAIRWCCR